MTERSMGTIYYEDLDIGAEFSGPSTIVDPVEMLAYNRKYDPWPFHVDEQAARESAYGGITASSGYSFSLLNQLSHQALNRRTARWAMIGGVDCHLRMPQPVRPGDHLRYRLAVVDKRPSSKPGRGVVQVREELVNQHDEVAFIVETVLLIATRPR